MHKNRSAIGVVDRFLCRKKLLRYTYDSLGQLTRVDSVWENKSIAYAYDNRGNITSKKEYAYTTGTLGTVTKTVNYAYGNTGWKDLLTSYNGQSITYDTIGNPLSYRGMTLTWQNGRQLATLTKSGATSSYSYDINGNRTKKVANGTTTEYYLNEGTIVAEKKGSNIIRYLFDENGGRFGFEYNGARYYYAFNGQGDVVSISNALSNEVARYTYDSWGKLLSVKDYSGNDKSGDASFVGNINPIRYKGYYYDTETGFYLTGTRYYDPVVGRFINADGYIAGAGGNVQGYNLFAYCFNNPVNMSDETGTWPSWNDIGNFFKDVGNKIVDGAKSVGKFFSDNFGAQTTTTVIEHEEKDELNFGFFKVSKTESISYEIEKGTSKTVTAYADTTSKKVGIKVKAGNVSGNIGTGLDGLLSEKASIKVQDTTYSFGYKEKVIFGDYSFSIANGNYTQTYSLELNKLNIATAVVAPYLIPMKAGGKLIGVFE